MIGTCHRCGTWGDVIITAVPNGGQRIYCHRCTMAPPPATPEFSTSRMGDLILRWKDGVITPEEQTELDGIVARLHTEAAHTGDHERARRYEAVRRELMWGPRRAKT